MHVKGVSSVMLRLLMLVWCASINRGLMMTDGMGLQGWGGRSLLGHFSVKPSLAAGMVPQLTPKQARVHRRNTTWPEQKKTWYSTPMHSL